MTLAEALYLLAGAILIYRVGRCIWGSANNA